MPTQEIYPKQTILRHVCSHQYWVNNTHPTKKNFQLGWPFADTSGSLTIPNLKSIFAFSKTRQCRSVTADQYQPTCQQGAPQHDPAHNKQQCHKKHYEFLQYSLDIFFNLWGRTEFPDRRSTRSLNHNLFPDPANVCLQSAIK